MVVICACRKNQYNMSIFHEVLQTQYHSYHDWITVIDTNRCSSLYHFSVWCWF